LRKAVLNAFTFGKSHRSGLAIVCALLVSVHSIAADTPVPLADPTIFYDKGTYYLYGTGGHADQGFTVYTSTDLEHWQGPAGVDKGYALLKGKTYGDKGFWAPQVYRYGNKYRMAYTANEQIAIAESNSPLGPFHQEVIRPISGEGKQIDPFVFTDDDGKRYLFHVRLKEGNRIFVAELDADGKDILPSTVKPVLHGDREWENTENVKWSVTEGPTVVKHKGKFYLLYSANDFRNKDYAVGYAVADHPLGPWTKTDDSPIISRNLIGLNGPGHGDLVNMPDGSMKYVFHVHHDSTKVIPRLSAMIDIRFEPSGSFDKLVADAKSFYLLQTDKAVNGSKETTSLPKEISNPVINTDFPDPTIIKVNGTYYAYATQTGTAGKMINIQVARSVNLQQWEILDDALPKKPAWASTTQDFWAPHVSYDKDLDQYVMFYSAESDEKATNKCIGVAFSKNPEGPFVDMGKPLVSGAGFVNIDPMELTDPASGKKLLYWGSGFEPIRVQELNPDYQSFRAGSSPVIVMPPGKEGNYTKLIEGAWVDVENGKYYLYYSGDNCCGAKANYAVMVARADHPLGPFKRMGEVTSNGKSVILEKNSQWYATGHNSIFKDENGDAWIAYHAISKDTSKGQKRVMCISRVKMKNGWPYVVQN